MHSPSEMPDRATIEAIREPYIRATILRPKEHVGAVMELCQERRGTHVDMTFLSRERVQLHYDLPLAEIVLDFFDQLKSRTRGYASLDYELLGMRESDLVKLDIMLAGDKVDALSMVVHRDKAYAAGRALTERLRKQIPRQQFEVAIQAAIGSKIIARESVKPMRKDVIAKCYGGDITPQAQAAREAEGGQEAHEAGRPRRGARRRRSWRCSSCGRGDGVSRARAAAGVCDARMWDGFDLPGATATSCAASADAAAAGGRVRARRRPDRARCGGEPAALVGASFGGWVCLQVARAARAGHRAGAARCAAARPRLVRRDARTSARGGRACSSRATCAARRS